MFQIGATDAETLAVEFEPEFLKEDLVNLGLYKIRLKLSVEGRTSRPFSAVILPPLARRGEETKGGCIIRISREWYGTPESSLRIESHAGCGAD